jgi:hypothetical protein
MNILLEKQTRVPRMRLHAGSTDLDSTCGYFCAPKQRPCCAVNLGSQAGQCPCGTQGLESRLGSVLLGPQFIPPPFDHTALFYVFKGSVWYRFCLIWSNIDSDTNSASWKASPGSLLPAHRRTLSCSRSEDRHRNSPMTQREGASRNAAGADAEEPRRSGSLN